MPNPREPQRPTASPPADGWAEVRAHDHVMRYRRSGVGRAVLVLRPGAGDDALWPGTGAALAERFRVVTPDAPAPGASAAAWLADFLEGLGMARVAILAADGFCMPALELALLRPDAISRVVLVPDGAAEETGLDGALASGAEASAVPLLVVRRALPAAEALPLVARFLDGE